MDRYLLIESRDPFESSDVAPCYGLATDLARAGNAVTLFLVQNGVFPARPGEAVRRPRRRRGQGVEVLADDFSLRERGIAAHRLVRGVKPAALDVMPMAKKTTLTFALMDPPFGARAARRRCA